MADKPEAKEKNGDILIGAYVSRELEEFLRCIIAADTHLSKSDIIRKAIEYYIENGIDPAVKQGAEEILRTRHRTLQVISG